MNFKEVLWKTGSWGFWKKKVYVPICLIGLLFLSKNVVNSWGFFFFEVFFKPCEFYVCWEIATSWKQMQA